MAGVALGEISERLGGELIGDAATRIDAIGPLESATPSTIAFLSNPQYDKQLASSRAACVIVAPAFRDAALARGAAIITADPYLYFARLTQWWAERTRPARVPGVHATAVVDPAAEIAADATIGAFAVIEAGVSIAAGVSVGAHAFVGRDCRVGAASRIGARATLLFETTLGARCVVHPGAVLGADGFGFAPTEGRWEKIEQLGRVRVGDDVEVGANSCIDRGATGDTVIADGVKIDNLVQIGEHTAIAGCVGIAGSASIGAHCMLGGGAGVSGHVKIADHVVIGGATQVSRSIAKAGFYSGSFPFDDNASWEKNAATLRNLYALRERVKALEKKVP